MSAAVETPADEAQLAEIVRGAAALRRGLEIRGGGSRQGLGGDCAAETVLSTLGLKGVTFYDPGALTMTVRAGTPFAEVEAALAENGQMLPFEPIDHRKLLGTQDRAPTIGGVVATGAAGPRRIQAGGCRDSVIGVRFVNGKGEAVKSGGRVMKNVTGYDLAKLLTASQGTLGVITEISFKLLPRPEHMATLRIDGLDEARAIEALSAALGSPYGVSGAAYLPSGADGAPVAMIRVEGFRDSARYRAERLQALLAEYGAGVIEEDAERTATGWRHVRDAELFAGRPGAVWRLSLKPGEAAEVVAGVRAATPIDDAFYDWGGGLVWLLTPDQGDAGAAAVGSAPGSKTLVRASAPVRQAAALLAGRPAAVLALEQALREKFDPAGVLNPGRMG